MQFFWQGKAQNSSPILRCTFLARRSAKLIANFSATMVTSLPSFSSLSLSPNVPHAHIGSASALPVIFSIFSTRKKNGATGNSIVCFPASIPCQSRHLTVRRMRTVSKSTFLAAEKCELSAIQEGEKTEVQFFWQGKAQNSSPILRCTFLARRSAKLIANFSATMVTSLPSFSLSLYLSLSLSLSLSLTECTSRTM